MKNANLLQQNVKKMNNLHFLTGGMNDITHRREEQCICKFFEITLSMPNSGVIFSFTISSKAKLYDDFTIYYLLVNSVFT
jgi:hypothetical protein